MFVLIISRGFPSLQDVMIGNFEADQARALYALGHKVVVLSIDRRLKAHDRHIGFNHRVIDGIDVYNFYMFPMPIKTMYKLGYFYIVQMVRFLYRIILRNHGRPDIIHAHYLYTMPIALKLKDLFNVPCVGTEHWSFLGKSVMPVFVRFYAERIYHRLDALITVSNSLGMNIRKQFGVKSCVIPNMLDVSKFNINAQSKFNRGKANFSFISVGALVDGKCFDLLLKAFSRLKFENKYLTIVGDGPKKHYLKNLIIELGIEKCVEFTGKLSREEMLPKLSYSNVFVLPSNSETFGVVYIEAMALGSPVIATKCGGPEDFVDSSNGLLIERNSEERLVDAMEYMYKHYNEYKRESISGSVINRYSPSKIARQIELLYMECLGK